MSGLTLGLIIAGTWLVVLYCLFVHRALFPKKKTESSTESTTESTIDGDEVDDKKTDTDLPNVDAFNVVLYSRMDSEYRNNILKQLDSDLIESGNKYSIEINAHFSYSSMCSLFYFSIKTIETQNDEITYTLAEVKFLIKSLIGEEIKQKDIFLSSLNKIIRENDGMGSLFSDKISLEANGVSLYCINGDFVIDSLYVLLAIEDLLKNKASSSIVLAKVKEFNNAINDLLEYELGILSKLFPNTLDEALSIIGRYVETTFQNGYDDNFLCDFVNETPIKIDLLKQSFNDTNLRFTYNAFDADGVNIALTIVNGKDIYSSRHTSTSTYVTIYEEFKEILLKKKIITDRLTVYLNLLGESHGRSKA